MSAQRPIRIIHLEDDDNDAELVASKLKDMGLQTEVTRVQSKDELEAALAQSSFDLIISDFSGPLFDGDSALAAAKSRWPEVPFIFVSGTMGEDVAVESLLKGATDYVLKTGKMSRLQPAVQRALRDAAERREKAGLEEQYRQAQKMQAVGQLAGGVAHDFNNLLTAILGYSYFLQGTFAADDARRGDLEEIIKASNRAAGLTQQLLAFSRRQILEPRIVDLNESVTNIEKMLRRLIGENIAIKVVLEPALWRVKVDPGQIEQVLMNLAVNARDAMPGGGVLTIGTSNTDSVEPADGAPSRHGPYATLTVSDTGAGMDAATQARAFEPFFTTKGPGKGTGLGLSTVYGIVQQSGGTISLQSAPNRGTTFRVHLPRADGLAQEGAPVASVKDGATGSETVLIVEDEENVRAIAKRALLERGYKVLEAADGEAALRTASEHDGVIHLVVSDLVLPGLDSIEMIERLLARSSTTKVLYMSGYTGNEIARHELLKGDKAYLRKPFTPNELARKVRATLDRKS